MAAPLEEVWMYCHTHPLSVAEGEPTETVEVEISLSVEYVEVFGPPGRQDNLCSIYGQILVCDQTKGLEPPMVLFHRSRDEAETINLGDPDLRFLTLRDDDSARPLLGGSPLYVLMKLFEKSPQDEEEDSLVADVDFEFNDYHENNKRRFFEFEGKSGFCFDMAYSNVFCAVSVQVQFTINTNQGQFIYGSIAATQFLGNGQAPVIKLFYADSDHPAQVEIGSPIELDRKVVATPTSGGVLGIAYDLYDAANGRLIAKNEVPFCIMRDGGYVTAPKNLTYTQEADDGLISISVTLIPFPDVHPED